MKNRYGKEYSFELVSENTYKFVGDTDWCRFGGKEGVDGIDTNDLGYFDPSGGPFIHVGYMIEGRKIVRIASKPDGVFFEVI
jgi:hypothetical protein